MLASAEFIPLVVKLAQAELFRNFTTGDHLVRGYADLGHEEFVLLGPARLASLYTGSPSSLPEGHEHFFSRVPSLDEMTDTILRSNFDIKEIEFKDQRTWHVTAEQIENKKRVMAHHREFECALALLLLEVVAAD